MEGVRDAPSFLPPFANTENKALDAEIRRLEAQLATVDVALEENSGRIGVMGEHLKNVEQELAYTETRVEAENKEVATENHLKQLAERETARVTKDMDRLERERLELQDKVLSLQQQIYRGTEKLEQFKLLMNWNQEELEQWATAQAQKEEDNSAIEKYRRQDDSKIRELSLHVEKLTKEVHSRKEELDAEVTETQAAQIQLDRVAQDFRKLHEERQALVAQWDDAVVQLRHKDAAIQAASEQFAGKRLELKQRQGELDAQARFLEAEMLNNKEMEARITLAEREVAKRRESQAGEQLKLQELENEVDMLRSTVAKTANELAMKGVENRSGVEELDRKRRRLDDARKKFAALKARLEGEFGRLDGLEARVAELENIRRQEEVRLKALQKENAELRKQHFRHSQALYQLRKKERELISEIAGGQSQNKNLASRIVGLDEQVVRQQELLYNVEFALTEMERKVARAKGHRSDEETRLLNIKISKLTAVLEELHAEHNMLVDQVKQAEEDLTQAKQANTKLMRDEARIDDKIATLQLEADSSGRQLRQATEEKERAMVEHDCMKLEVKRLRELLNLRVDEVFSLEARQLQLKSAMEERKQEIELHRDELRAEQKQLKEDVHRVTLELRERELRVERLQAKFETLSSKGVGGDDVDDEGQPRSQAYYVIKAAQEREELQRNGDTLDISIRKAEAEVSALEATLQSLVGINTAFNSSLRRTDDTSSTEAKATLRQQLDASYDRLKLRRTSEASLMNDVAAGEARVNSLVAETSGLAGLVAELGRRKAEAERLLADQQDKHTRACKASERALRQLRARLGQEGGGTPQELDVALATAREVNQAMLQEARVLAMQLPDAGILETLEAAGVRVPPPGGGGSGAGSLSGSRPGSRTSASLRSAASTATSFGAASLKSEGGGGRAVRTVQIGAGL